MSTPWERAADALRNADGLELDEALRLVREAYQPPEPASAGAIVMAAHPAATGAAFYVRTESGWCQDGDGGLMTWAEICGPGWTITELEPVGRAGRVGTLLDELTEALGAPKDIHGRMSLIRSIVDKWAAKE